MPAPCRLMAAMFDTLPGQSKGQGLHLVHCPSTEKQIKKKHNKTNQTNESAKLKKTNNTKFNPIINEVSNEQNPVKII